MGVQVLTTYRDQDNLIESLARPVPETQLPPTHCEAINAYDPFRAEAAISRFLRKYPDSDLVPMATQTLAVVREDLAEGYFRVAGFFFDRGDNARALSLLNIIFDRHPDFSRIDEAGYWHESLSASGQQQETPRK